MALELASEARQDAILQPSQILITTGNAMSAVISWRWTKVIHADWNNCFLGL